MTAFALSSPLTRSALRKISASHQAEAQRAPLDVQKQQRLKLAGAAAASSGGSGAIGEDDGDEAADDAFASSGVKSASVHKRTSIERERLIQEYTTYQNGLAPSKRLRRASRKLASPPASPSRTASPRSSAGSVVDAAVAVKEAENVPPPDVATANHDVQTPVAADENVVVKPSSTSASEKLPGSTTTPTTVTRSVSAPPPAVSTVAVATLSNEEKHMDGAPEGELFLVNVLAREEIQPSADVETEAQELEALLAHIRETQSGESTSEAESELSWGKEYYAVDSVRRFAIHHPDHLKQHIETALPLLVCPAVSSLRSAMTRNALLCIQDVILCLQDDASNSFDAFIPLLLNRASSEKQFIRDLAREVLDTAVKTCANEALLLNLLRMSVVEKNPQAVNVIGLYVNKCITRMDNTIYQAFALEKHESFIEEMTALLNCKIVECKVITRKSLQHTRKVLGESKFVALVKSKLSGSSQFDVLKASELKQAAKPAAATKQLSMRERMMQMRKQQMGKQHRSADNFDVVVAASAPPPLQQQSS